MLKEFKEFAMKGNLVDIAVGFVMGAAFTRLVTSFTGGIVTPLISMITGDVKFDNLKLVLRDGIPEVKDAAGAVTTPGIAEVAVLYGDFLQATVDFIIVAFVMFMVVKAVNRMKTPEAAAAPAGPTDDQKLLMEIRDLLKK
ncbi:MAG: large-conductance mechanosensitive channel protein MscL [Flavobacteriales bacterium]|nr:large-conductance mechanosensitive channel protein MscL [Flavobacteriales bacterium]MBK6893902.1 large-conductance mechanosensitive channel protein MscL [Flavobacteriales bacterium]MBK7247846.1 large-conductance mechanosensitive channel protein MscL [Flavobacteriales bacterium]MBK9060314.1 large-conductance mechanosensitive channel protein MscL [Flavobacteriales bacterium]MBK9597221.1 large-conductance mechanosensitive channel protein MscL [Flavobacteriales bacterium]